MDESFLRGFVAPNLSVIVAGVATLLAGRRWPWVVGSVIGVAVVCSAGLLRYTVVEGIAYNYTAGDIDFGSEAGRECYYVGLWLVSLGLPAALLVLAARERQPNGRGPQGLKQYATLVMGYWCCCALVVFVLYTTLTGHAK